MSSEAEQVGKAMTLKCCFKSELIDNQVLNSVDDFIL